MIFGSRRILFIAATTAFLAMYFVVYAFLPLFAPDLPNSPDEMANRYFTERFADLGELWSFEELNLVADGRVHPRSVRVVDDFLVPGGFIGLPVIYGSIAKAFGKAVIPFLTPLIAAFTALAWGALVARIASGDGARVRARSAAIGWIAAVLLLANPAWWYAASRTMMPNVLFASLVILSAATIVVRPVRSALTSASRATRLRIADPLLGGALAALAVAVRPVELYWLVPCTLIVAVMLRRRFAVRDAALFIAAVALTLLPFAILNRSAYGNIFASGYGEGIASPGIEIGGGLGTRLLGPLQPYLFPLGFAPRTSLANFVTYGMTLFWWWGLAVAAAFGIALGRRYRTGERMSEGMRAFAAASAFATVWLVLFYGSYAARDNPDPDAVTIGSSYVRYWLPLFVASTVPVAAGIVRAAEGIAPRLRASAVGASVGLLAALSAVAVFAAPQDGLLAMRNSLTRYAAEIGDVLARTEQDAVIVTDRADKLLFPARRVVQPLRDEGTYAVLSEIAAQVPLYYYGITLPPEDLAHLRDTRLPPLGLTVDLVASYEEESLYRFSPVTRSE